MENAQEEQWSPPSTLTAPVEASDASPVVPFALAALVTLGCTVALALVSQFIYVWILTNVLIGNAIGWALAKAPAKNYRNLKVLAGVAIALSCIPYMANMGYIYFQALQDGANVSFIDVVLFVFENKTLFGFELGLIGNALLFVAEVAYTAYTAINVIRAAIQNATFSKVPDDVLSFVVGAFYNEWSQERIDSALVAYGWTRQEDRDNAINLAIHAIEAR